MVLRPESDRRRDAGARELEDPVHGPWWYVSPPRLLGKMLVIAASVGAMMLGATEWLKYEWENAPTHYPDGRVLHADGSVEYPDGRVVRRGDKKTGTWIEYPLRDGDGDTAAVR